MIYSTKNLSTTMKNKKTNSQPAAETPKVPKRTAEPEPPKEEPKKQANLSDAALQRKKQQRFKRDHWKTLTRKMKEYADATGGLLVVNWFDPDSQKQTVITFQGSTGRVISGADTSSLHTASQDDASESSEAESLSESDDES